MKIKLKITILISFVFIAFFLFFIGYEYIRNVESELYQNSKKLRDEQIIDKVLEFKSGSFLSAVADNGSWDEMVNYTKTKDSIWAKKNFYTILSSYSMSNFGAYSLNGELLYNVADEKAHHSAMSPSLIKQMFASKSLIHCFHQDGENLHEIFGATIVPVTDAGRQNDAYGYLICSKVWDEKYISEIEEATGFMLSVNSSYDLDSIQKAKSDTIFRVIKGADKSIIGQLVFYRSDTISEQLNAIQYWVLGGLIGLLGVILIIVVLTRKWFIAPLKKITNSLSRESTGVPNSLLHSHNEFGNIARLIQQYNEQKYNLLKEVAEKTAATQALKEAHQFSDMIYKVIPSALFTVDNNKCVTSWNKKAELITGYSAEEMLGKSCDEFSVRLSSEHCDLFNPDVPKPISGHECTIIHKSGRRISIIKNIDELRDVDGRVIGGIESFEDVTESKRIEAELRQSESRYSTLVRKMPNMMLIHSKGNLLFVNEASVNVIGYSFEELKGTPLFHYLTPESAQIVKNVISLRASGENNIKDYELQVITKSGEIKDVIIKTEMITFDNEDAVLTILTDITERKQFEKLLIERELKLNTITSSANDGIIMIDNEGLVSFWNPAAEEIFGYTEEEIIGKSLHSIIAPGRYMPAHMAAFKNFQATGKGNAIGETLELSAMKKGGDEIDVELSLSAIKLNGLWVAVGIVRDITERKLDEIALQRAKVEAERANKAKSEFLAMMSHEIRTPMNAVIGMTELTLTTNLSQTQREYLEAVQSSAYSLLDTINDILDFSKIEAGKLELENREFNLREMVERSVEILNVKAYSKSIELLFEIEPSLPKLFIGDPTRIRQILINLIGNAIKFTDKGEICVSVTMHQGSNPIDNVRIPVQFSVRDTGIGIPREKQLSIFNSFEQADRSTTRKYGGTGLGLSISRSLTEIMDGTIWVESTYGVGSTFSFEIPLIVASDQLRVTSGEIINIKNVLVIDDNATNLRIMHDMLDYWGIQSTICSDGASALHVLEDSEGNNVKYDLVILDMHMPEMDGLMVAEKIKSELNLGSEPLILMFSSIEKENLQKMGKDVGIDRFLSKPVKMYELYELLTGIVQNNEANGKDMIQCEHTGSYYDKTIMVVEDNSLNMKLMNALLYNTGAKIVNANDGAAAVDLYKSMHIDLILMDVHMPVMDGFDATKMIRSIEGTLNHIPIIALTAIAMVGDRERCINAGMDDYLSKPFKKNELFDILTKFLISDLPSIQPQAELNMHFTDRDQVFDKCAFLQLTGNDQELYTELLEHYKGLMPSLLDKLSASMKSLDYSQIAFHSHTIKGMSSNLHANRISLMAKSIELLANTNGEINEMQVLVKQLNDEFSTFLEFIRMHA